MSARPQVSRVERALNVLTEVRPGEARTALLLGLNVFLILMAYYILKTVREALILGEGTAELKSYLSAGQVMVLAFAVPFYGRLVARFRRMTLINIVTVFFVACPLVFYVLARAGVPLGMIYFVWIGIFSLMIVAQFWSFANDVYSKEEGERLLVIVGLGASLGAVAGARVADRLIEPFGVLQLMLLGAGVLGLQLLLTNYIDRRELARRPPVVRVKTAHAAPAENAFAMVFRTRYLLLMALMILVVNWINATGEYILGSIVKEYATDMVAAGTAPGLSEGQIIGDFYAKYFSLANVAGLILQLFVVSRVVKYAGVAWAVMILPALTFGVYNIFVFVPFLNAAGGEGVENSTDCAEQHRTACCSCRVLRAKFAAKQAIDSFFVRMGDALGRGRLRRYDCGTAVARLRGGECGPRRRRADPVACRPLL
jgi:AAA family ATP:ADP antiporter